MRDRACEIALPIASTIARLSTIYPRVHALTAGFAAYLLHICCTVEDFPAVFP
jgi:hypothetical protein